MFATQWTTRQIHDTVAAIVAQPEYAPVRESLLGRLARFLFRKFNEFLDWFRGTANPKLLLVVVGAVVVSILIGRIIADRRAARAAALRLRHRPGGTRSDPWSDARALADAGSFTNASHVLYGAVVSSLVARGLVRFHKSKTSGDYARELRRARAPITDDFRVFGRDFDRAVYSRDVVTSDEYQTLAAAAERIARALSIHSAA